VLWVEPGTFAASRKLISARERLLGKSGVIAPCTHARKCGMLAAGNERHWCHHFAKIPGYVHVDSGWGRFSKELEIDISTLPYSYLVLDRRAAAANPGPEPARVIGVPRHYKGFAKILSCQGDGVRELTLQKRDAQELFKALKKDPGSLYRWDLDGEKIHGGERVV
jgi:ribosomal protein RSM22 (predicted rRNA methylase)